MLDSGESPKVDKKKQRYLLKRTRQNSLTFFVLFVLTSLFYSGLFRFAIYMKGVKYSFVLDVFGGIGFLAGICAAVFLARRYGMIKKLSATWRLLSLVGLIGLIVLFIVALVVILFPCIPMPRFLVW